MNISKHHSRYNFSRLHADIVEEDGAFTVRVRMLNHLQKKNQGAWGEEIAPTFELATAMIDELARQFSIPQNCIFIKIIMTLQGWNNALDRPCRVELLRSLVATDFAMVLAFFIAHHRQKCPLVAQSRHKLVHWTRPLGKADMTIGTCPLSWSLSGVKQTSLVAPHISAFGGKAECKKPHAANPAGPTSGHGSPALLGVERTTL